MTQKLPDKIPIRCIAMLDMAGGGSRQHYRNEQFGVTCTKERSHRSDPFTESWGMDGFDGAFPNYAALQKAVNHKVQADARHE